MDLLQTPDDRYIVIHGRLWRRHRPDLEPMHRDRLIRELMDARRAVRAGRRARDQEAIQAARSAVDVAKHALGERGPVWWADGAPDLDRRMIKNTPYASWYDSLPRHVRSSQKRR